MTSRITMKQTYIVLHIKKKVKQKLKATDHAYLCYRWRTGRNSTVYLLLRSCLAPHQSDNRHLPRHSSSPLFSAQPKRISFKNPSFVSKILLKQKTSANESNNNTIGGQCKISRWSKPPKQNRRRRERVSAFRIDQQSTAMVQFSEQIAAPFNALKISFFSSLAGWKNEAPLIHIYLPHNSLWRLVPLWNLRGLVILANFQQVYETGLNNRVPRVLILQKPDPLFTY